jgi:uncharacterized protein YggE
VGGRGAVEDALLKAPERLAVGEIFQPPRRTAFGQRSQGGQQPGRARIVGELDRVETQAAVARQAASALSSPPLCCTLLRMTRLLSPRTPLGQGRLRGLRALLGLLFMGAVGFAPGGCLADPAASGSASAPRIRAAGEAVVVVPADRAWVNVAVVTRNPEAVSAVAENAEESQRVSAALRDAVGEGGEIASAGYSLAPNYRYVQGQGQQLDGYIVRNRLRVTLEEVAAAGRVIDAASRAGASEIQQVSYGLADDGPAQREALAKATRNGMERAGVMAAALDMRVTGVLSVEDSGAAPAPVVRQVRSLAKPSGGSSVPTELRPGGIHVHAAVTVYVEVGP